MGLAVFQTSLFHPVGGIISQSTLVYISQPEGLVVSESYHVVITANTRVNDMVRPAVLNQKFHMAVFKNYKCVLWSRKLNM